MAVVDVSAEYNDTDDVRTPPISIKAGRQLVSAAFLKLADGPVQDEVEPYSSLYGAGDYHDQLLRHDRRSGRRRTWRPRNSLRLSTVSARYSRHLLHHSHRARARHSVWWKFTCSPPGPPLMPQPQTMPNTSAPFFFPARQHTSLSTAPSNRSCCRVIAMSLPEWIGKRLQCGSIYACRFSAAMATFAAWASLISAAARSISLLISAPRSSIRPVM